MLKKAKLFLITHIFRNSGLASSFLFILLNSMFGAIPVNAEDYTEYAKLQEQKSKEIIAPYKAEVDVLVKNALLRQEQPDIQEFKKEITNAAKSKCLYQYQSQEKTLSRQPTVPIMIFVSFSMPIESIKQWIAQANKISASVYIRGLVNNSFKDTTKVVRELVKDQIGGLLIDPTVFKKYAINQVPAVVVVNNSNFDVVYGDVSLDYALEKISKEAQITERQLLLDAVGKLRNKK